MYIYTYIYVYIYTYCELITLAADRNPTKMANELTLSDEDSVDPVKWRKSEKASHAKWIRSFCTTAQSTMNRPTVMYLNPMPTAMVSWEDMSAEAASCNIKWNHIKEQVLQNLHSPNSVLMWLPEPLESLFAMCIRLQTGCFIIQLKRSSF